MFLLLVVLVASFAIVAEGSTVSVEIWVESKSFATEPAPLSAAAMEWNYAVVFACPHNIL